MFKFLNKIPPKKYFANLEQNNARNLMYFLCSINREIVMQKKILVCVVKEITELCSFLSSII